MPKICVDISSGVYRQRPKPLALSAMILFGLTVVAGVTGVSGAASASVMFSDSTYNPTDYSVAFDYQNTANPVTSSVFAAVPGNGLTFTMATNGPSNGSAILNGVLNNTFTYNPATQGAITSISASAFKTFTVTNEATSNYAVAFGNNFRPLIEQGGNYYEAAIPGPNVGPVPEGGTQTVSATQSNNDLTLSDFFEIDPSTGTITGSHGSLSFTNGAMTFGIAQLLNSAGAQVSASANYQDFKIGISTVPLPASAPLFGGALAVMGLCGYGLKKKAEGAAA